MAPLEQAPPLPSAPGSVYVRAIDDAAQALCVAMTLTEKQFALETLREARRNLRRAMTEWRAIAHEQRKHWITWLS
jgi:hypothetical protein